MPNNYNFTYLKSSIETFTIKYQVKPRAIPLLLLCTAGEYYVNIAKPVFLGTDKPLNTWRPDPINLHHCASMFILHRSYPRHIPGIFWLEFSFNNSDGVLDKPRNALAYKALNAYINNMWLCQPLIPGNQEQINTYKKVNELPDVRIRLPIKAFTSLFLQNTAPTVLNSFLTQTKDIFSYDPNLDANTGISLIVSEDDRGRNLKFKL